MKCKCVQVVVARRAVLQRVNRLLAKRRPAERLVVAKRTRGVVSKREDVLGRFFRLRNKCVVETFVDLDVFARACGALQDFEKLEDGYMA